MTNDDHEGLAVMLEYRGKLAAAEVLKARRDGKQELAKRHDHALKGWIELLLLFQELREAAANAPTPAVHSRSVVEPTRPIRLSPPSGRRAAPMSPEVRRDLKTTLETQAMLALRELQVAKRRGDLLRARFHTRTASGYRELHHLVDALDEALEQGLSARGPKKGVAT
jgi:hypothetical protein